MTRVDSFCHIYTSEYLKDLDRDCESIEISTDPTNGRTEIIDRTSNEVLNFLFLDSPFTNLEKRLEHMDKFKIDKQILSAGQPTIDTTLLHITPKASVRLARKINDSLAALIKGYEERFAAVAEIPLLDMDLALDELDRAVNELGLRGIQLNTTIGGKPLDSEEFRPVFSKASKMRIPILIHPCTVSSNQRRRNELDFSLHRILGWPFETSLALARLVFAGIFEDYPSLKIITHHASAMIPFFANRIDFFYSREIRQAHSLPKSPQSYFKQLYHDTATEGSIASLLCVQKAFGSDNLIFASDYPFRNDDSVLSVIRAIENLEISEEGKEQIFSGNALRVFNL